MVLGHQNLRGEREWELCFRYKRQSQCFAGPQAVHADGGRALRTKVETFGDHGPNPPALRMPSKDPWDENYATDVALGPRPRRLR